MGSCSDEACRRRSVATGLKRLPDSGTARRAVLLGEDDRATLLAPVGGIIVGGKSDSSLFATKNGRLTGAGIAGEPARASVLAQAEAHG